MNIVFRSLVAREVFYYILAVESKIVIIVGVCTETVAGDHR